MRNNADVLAHCPYCGHDLKVRYYKIKKHLLDTEHLEIQQAHAMALEIIRKLGFEPNASTWASSAFRDVT